MNSINSIRRRTQKALKRNESNDLEFVDLEVPLPSSSHISRDESSTKLPILPRHLMSQEGRNKDKEKHRSSSSERTPTNRDSNDSSKDGRKWRRRANGSKVRFADTVDERQIGRSADYRLNRQVQQLDDSRSKKRANQLQILENNNLVDPQYDYMTPDNRSRGIAKISMEESQKQKMLPNSCLKKRKAEAKLSILEQSGIMVIREGQVLNNDQLSEKIRVPEKIQRKFTIARDYAEQNKSSERLANSKKPFSVPPLQ